MDDIILELKDITKTFGSTSVLSGINLSVKSGEFITLLGSSGCGKTTTLRIIAGLETADSGSVLLENIEVSKTDPNKRDVNTVFQNYALFPHMTVAQNIGYSLKLKKKNKVEITQAVKDALSLVQLDGYENRKPNELSGGQKQRVAIARAIINKPKVLLLDEPLGALDLQLRRQMQIELKKLQKQLGITFIYITHDQEEALNMSDQIAVMRDGKFEQIGSPSEIYNFPKTSYVAKFVGSANIIKAKAISSKKDIIKFTCASGDYYAKNRSDIVIKENQDISLALRSEQIKLQPYTENQEGLYCKVSEISFSGSMLRIVLILNDGQEVIASMHGIDTDFKIGDELLITYDFEQTVLVDLEV